jgi:hypothetical protein
MAPGAASDRRGGSGRRDPRCAARHFHRPRRGGDGHPRTRRVRVGRGSGHGCRNRARSLHATGPHPRAEAWRNAVPGGRIDEPWDCAGHFAYAAVLYKGEEPCRQPPCEMTDAEATAEGGPWIAPVDAATEIVAAISANPHAIGAIRTRRVARGRSISAARVSVSGELDQVVALAAGRTWRDPGRIPATPPTPNRTRCAVTPASVHETDDNSARRRAAYAPSLADHRDVKRVGPKPGLTRGLRRNRARRGRRRRPRQDEQAREGAYPK